MNGPDATAVGNGLLNPLYSDDYYVQSSWANSKFLQILYISSLVSFQKRFYGILFMI